MQKRGSYYGEDDQLFISSDGTPVRPHHVRTVLRMCIGRVGLNANLYDVHSLRIGCSSDLFHKGYTLEQIKLAGRWKSNAVYHYLKL